MVQTTNLEDVGFLQDRWENDWKKTIFSTLICARFRGKFHFCSFWTKAVVSDHRYRSYNFTTKAQIFYWSFIHHICLSLRLRQFFHREVVKWVNNISCEHFSKAKTRVEGGRPNETFLDKNMQSKVGTPRRIKAPVEKTIAENLG